MRRTKAKATKAITQRAHKRRLMLLTRHFEAQASALQGEIVQLRNTNRAQARRIQDMASLYITGECYYRAQRLIAELLDVHSDAISASLAEDILGALYHGITPKGLRDRVTEGRGFPHPPDTAANTFPSRKSDDAG